MGTIIVQADMRYDVQTVTSFSMAIAAARTRHQVVTAESIEILPTTALAVVPYGEGNHQLVRFDAQPGDLSVSYRATVTLNGTPANPAALHEVPFGQIPPEVLPYLNPSRYCESDRLGRFALRHFGHVDPGHTRVQAVADWVRGNLLYEPGVTDGSTGTAEVLLQRSGVCRDFADVSISLCRAIGIPARYVSGYGVDVEPQDFHGFFEAYLSDEWYLFDPTGMSELRDLVRIGFGRDAADTPFASFVGSATLSSKTVRVERRGDPGIEPEATSTA